MSQCHSVGEEGSLGRRLPCGLAEDELALQSKVNLEDSNMAPELYAFQSWFPSALRAVNLQSPGCGADFSRLSSESRRQAFWVANLFPSRSAPPLGGW